MRFRIKISLPCVVALLSTWLIACDRIAVEDGPETSCPAACEQKHPDGLKKYNAVAVTCACDSCNQSCAQSVCDNKQTPNNNCLPCVQESLGGDACIVHSGFFETVCLSDADCTALVSCILACNP